MNRGVIRTVILGGVQSYIDAHPEANISRAAKGGISKRVEKTLLRTLLNASSTLVADLEHLHANARAPDLHHIDAARALSVVAETAAGDAIEKAKWCRDLSDYYPRPGDWVVMTGQQTHAVVLVTSKDQIAYGARGELMVGLPSPPFPFYYVRAYWRPPGPPPIPEDLS